MKRLFAVCLGVGLLVRVGSAVVIPVNCNLFFNGSNAVQIAWNAYPGGSLDIMRFAAELEQRGGTHLVAEVSSHALALGRVWGFHFHTAVFTNLTRDHLDFH